MKATLHLLLRPPLALGMKATEAALRLGLSATAGQSQARRRRQRLLLPPLANHLAPSPPSSAHRLATLRTHLPLPSRLRWTVDGARPLQVPSRPHRLLRPPQRTKAPQDAKSAPRGRHGAMADAIHAGAVASPWREPEKRHGDMATISRRYSDALTAMIPIIKQEKKMIVGTMFFGDRHCK